MYKTPYFTCIIYVHVYIYIYCIIPTCTVKITVQNHFLRAISGAEIENTTGFGTEFSTEFSRPWHRSENIFEHRNPISGIANKIEMVPGPCCRNAIIIDGRENDSRLDTECCARARGLEIVMCVCVCVCVPTKNQLFSRTRRTASEKLINRCRGRAARRGNIWSEQ